MASDHEIDVLNGLIAAMRARLAVVNSSSGDTGLRGRRQRMLKNRIQGLIAQITALSGESNVAAIDDVDMEKNVLKLGFLQKAGATIHAGADWASVFRTALDDGQVGISTRAAINTAWFFLETEFNEATLIKTRR